jgi:hypothetical protein
MNSILAETAFWVLLLFSLPAVFFFFKGLTQVVINLLFPLSGFKLRVIEHGKETFVTIEDADARTLIDSILRAKSNAEK